MSGGPGHIGLVDWEIKEIREAVGQWKSRQKTTWDWGAFYHKQIVALADGQKPAHQLDVQLPHDLAALRKIVSDPSQPLERRAKILEVIILRGADEKKSYRELEKIANGDDRGFFWGPQEMQYELDCKEKVAYQQAALELVKGGDPALFGQLSHSTKQLPDSVGGHLPATEWMNMMLREGGQLGSHEKDDDGRGLFTKWLLELPPEQRGEAMFHIRDAAGAKEQGEVRRYTGFEVSAGVARASGAGLDVGFGLQWDNPKNMHWEKVDRGVLAEVENALGYNFKPGEPDPAKADERSAFYGGYILADRGLPGIDPTPAGKK